MTTMTLESVRERRARLDDLARPDIAKDESLKAKEDAGTMTDSDYLERKAVDARMLHWDEQFIEVSRDEANIRSAKVGIGDNEKWEKVDALEAFINGGSVNAIRGDFGAEFIDGQDFVIDYPEMINTIRPNPLENAVQTYPNDDIPSWGVDIMPDPMNIISSFTGMISVCRTRNTPNGQRYGILQLAEDAEGAAMTGREETDVSNDDIEFVATRWFDYGLFTSNPTRISRLAEEDNALRGSLAAFFTQLLMNRVGRSESKAVSIGGVTDSETTSLVETSIPAHVTKAGVTADPTDNRRLAGLTLDELLKRISSLITALGEDYRQYEGGRRLAFLCSDEFFWGVLVDKLRDTNKRSLIQFEESGITGPVIARIYGIPIVLDYNFAKPTGTNLDVGTSEPIMALVNGANYEFRRVSRFVVHIDPFGKDGDRYRRRITVFHRAAGQPTGPFIPTGRTNAGKSTSLALWQANSA